VVRVRLLSAVSALTLTLVVTSCAGTPSGHPDGHDGGRLTLASGNDNNSFDPAALEIGHRVQYWMPVYDTLLVLDEDGDPQPNLATGWSYNADATILNLKLRDDVTFTDGAPFDSAAVQANLEHLAAGSGQNSYMAASIAEFDIVDDLELNLVLSAPDPGLLGYLGVVAGAMASPASLADPDIAFQPVGSGPYLLDVARTSSGSQYVYVRNEDYWNTGAFPYDEVVIKPMSETTARLNALRSGQVDAAPAVASTISQAQASGLQVNRTQVNWVGLFIADRDGAQVPALGDERVRQAINLAFDTEAIVENVMLGEGSVTDQIFNPAADAFDAELDGAYPYDPDEAKSLMAEAGYADGFAVRMPRIDAYSNLNPIIEQSLAELNITVDWVAEAPDAAVSSVLSGKYPMFFFQLGSQSGWQDIQKSVLPTSPWNPFRVEDDELSTLVATAQASTHEDRAAAMQAVNEWLVENAWFDPWYRENTVYLSNAQTNVVMQSQNVVPWIRGFTPAD